MLLLLLSFLLLMLLLLSLLLILVLVHFEEGRAGAMTDRPMLMVLWVRVMVVVEKPHHFR